MNNYLEKGSSSNDKKPKKKLLTRGPKISPDNQFKPTDIQTTEKLESITSTKRVKKESFSSKRDSSVRVKRSTRNKLNALVSLNKADTIDELIEIMIDEYMSVNVLKDEKKQFDLVMELYKLKE